MTKISEIAKASQSKNPINYLLEWRKNNPIAYKEKEIRRIEIIKNSINIKNASRETLRKNRKIYRSKSKRFKKGELYVSCKSWDIRSPKGIRYKFIGLANFIRENPKLFNPEDLIWKTTTTKTSQICRAYSGISSLFGKVKTAGSWKGWTAVSDIERENDGKDLLSRNIV